MYLLWDFGYETFDRILAEKFSIIAIIEYNTTNKSGKLSQDTPVLPQVVKLGHAPDKIQVWKTTKGTNSKIKQARVMILSLWDLSTHEIS